jgi:hypothetical protein
MDAELYSKLTVEERTLQTNRELEATKKILETKNSKDYEFQQIILKHMEKNETDNKAILLSLDGDNNNQGLKQQVEAFMKIYNGSKAIGWFFGIVCLTVGLVAGLVEIIRLSFPHKT